MTHVGSLWFLKAEERSEGDCPKSLEARNICSLIVEEVTELEAEGVAEEEDDDDEDDEEEPRTKPLVLGGLGASPSVSTW